VGDTLITLIMPDVLLIQEERVMQEEMAWKSHEYGPAATEIGYRSGKMEERSDIRLSSMLETRRHESGGYAGDERGESCEWTKCLPKLFLHVRQKCVTFRSGCSLLP
jgi:hypothetical protein